MFVLLFFHWSLLTNNICELGRRWRRLFFKVVVESSFEPELSRICIQKLTSVTDQLKMLDIRYKPCTIASSQKSKES